MPIIIVGAIIVLIIFLQGYAYNKLWDKDLSFSARFSAKDVFEGDVVSLREELINRKFLPLPWVNTRIDLPPELTFVNKENVPQPNAGKGSSLFAIMGYRAIRRRRRFICTKRGLYNLRTARIYAHNLLHTQKFSKDSSLRGEVLVFPKLLDGHEATELLLSQLDSAILSRRIIDPDPFEFRGIRDYQPTDALKNINFKASAVQQSLMVNVLAPTAAKKITLALNLQEVDQGVSQEIYEQSIRLTATLAQHFIQDGASLSFYTNGRDTVTANTAELGRGNSGEHLYKIFECLARLATSYICQPLAHYVEEITDREEVFLFISPYYGEDFAAAVKELSTRGVAAYWIAPVRREGEGPSASDNVMVWKC